MLRKDVIPADFKRESIILILYGCPITAFGHDSKQKIYADVNRLKKGTHICVPYRSFNYQ
jgi:hypothetical protein